MAATTDKAVVDYRHITENQRKSWSLGDYQPIALQTMDMNEELIRAINPHPTQRILDVACGSGNGALVAARRDCEVFGIDFVPDWIERARKRAEAEGVVADFKVGDAQDIPYPDNSFDVVVSVLGVMFVPDQEKAASELLRVCKPGGKIGLWSHTPDGVVGKMFGVLAPYSPPPPNGLKSPMRWGTEDGIHELLGGGTRSIENTPKTMYIYARSVDYQVEMFKKYYGPTSNLFNTLPPDKHEEVHNTMIDLLQSYNRATNGTMILEIDYIQTIAVRV